MFIELTDHLRCPADHDASFLVLLPTEMDGRLVRAGVLGCPICHQESSVEDGIVDFGGAPPAPAATGLAPEAAHALLGLDGPGGYVTLVGGAGALAEGLAALLPGVRFVLVNPPAGAAPTDSASVLRAARLPIKAAAMRGAVITADHAADPAWLEATLACVLPGLRVLVEGEAIDRAGVNLLAEAGGWWVGGGER
ncbi:MAG TPA: hypothetical protein VMK53_03325 [Gemmatimonadales bacterium]|nr:hypothetical protein [Gemmatimonadales bacterium]